MVMLGDGRMDMISIRMLEPIYFTVRVPCGTWWQGIRHSADVDILVNRAFRHVSGPNPCENCAKTRRSEPVSRKNASKSIDHA
jgi:hypothetical protein